MLFTAIGHDTPGAVLDQSVVTFYKPELIPPFYGARVANSKSVLRSYWANFYDVNKCAGFWLWPFLLYEWYKFHGWDSNQHSADQKHQSLSKTKKCLTARPQHFVTLPMTDMCYSHTKDRLLSGSDIILGPSSILHVCFAHCRSYVFLEALCF